MIRATIAGCIIGIFWFGFYTRAHLQNETCRALHGIRPPLHFIDC